MPSDSQLKKDDERTNEKKDRRPVEEATTDRLDEHFGGKVLRTNPFGASMSEEYGYKRAERIMAAVHLMTAHIEQIEPLRISLRKESIQLLDRALLVHGELRAVGSERVRDMNASIRKLISLARLASISGKISAQNANITVEALDELGAFLITAQRSVLAETVPLTRDDLIPRSEIRKKESPLTQAATTHRKQTISGGIRSKDTSIKDMNVRNESPSDARSSRIVSFLRTGGVLGIKDIASQLPEYSEKMIQRDLALLVSSGQVHKIGSKRWSKYELVR